MNAIAQRRSRLLLQQRSRLLLLGAARSRRASRLLLLGAALLVYVVYVVAGPRPATAHESAHPSHPRAQAQHDDQQDDQHNDRLAIDFEATDLNGNAFHGIELKGRIVLLDFWAVWCPPCLDAFPKLTGLARELRDEQFDLVAIAAYSGSAAAVREFLEDYTADYTQVVGDEDLVYRYGVIGYPTYFLVDPEGNIYRKYVGALPGLIERVKADVSELKAKFHMNERSSR